MSTAVDCDVAVIGAGPYGLSAAAHARGAGLQPVVFGRPMSFWDEEMPERMLLRSPYVASNLSDPGGVCDLDHFKAETGARFEAPIPVEDFVAYGRWFQQRNVPDVDERWINRVAKENGHFRLEAADGSSLRAGQVVVAAGISCFANIPEQFRGLPEDRVSHACGHHDLRPFAGRRVAVIGAGQSALESAALLREAEANVEVLSRDPQIYFLRRAPWMHRLGPISRLMFAPPDVGPAGLSRLVAMPALYRRLPRRWHDRWGVRAIRPAGAAWLRPRLEDVPLRTGVAVRRASLDGEGVRLDLTDGSVRTADHVMLATGYDVRISGYDFLEADLLAGVRRTDGYPHLGAGFETTVPGLHIIGAPAAWTFGPLMRFVAGTTFTAPRVAASVAERARARA